MLYRIDSSKNIVVFRPSGKLDIGNAKELEDMLDKLRELNPQCNFIIDLSTVEYCSSSALRVIVTTYRKLTEVQQCLVLLNPSSICAKILEVTKLGDVIDIYDNELDAINSLY